MNRSPQIFIGLYKEGSTDRRFFTSVIQRTFQDVNCDCGKDIHIMDVIDIEIEKSSFADDVVAASRKSARDFGISVLCIHADADEATDTSAFNNKINPSLRKIEAVQDEACKIIVPIVPVRMTEAWMLADRILLKSQPGANKSDQELGFDRNPEHVANPKALITEAIRIVSQEKSRRHRNDLNISVLYQRLGESIPLESLRQLPSFRKFEDNARHALRELKFLN